MRPDHGADAEVRRRGTVRGRRVEVQIQQSARYPDDRGRATLARARLPRRLSLERLRGATMLLNHDRAVRVMQRLGLDALVATSPENVMYASDYECSTHWLNKGAQVYAVLTPGARPAAFLVAPSLELEAIVGSPVWIEDVYLTGFFKRGPAPIDAMDDVGRAAVAVTQRAHQVETAMDGLVAALTTRGLDRGRIGLDEGGMSAQIWAEITRRLPNATILPATAAWWDIRMVKT